MDLLFIIMNSLIEILKWVAYWGQKESLVQVAIEHLGVVGVTEREQLCKNVRLIVAFEHFLALLGIEIHACETHIVPQL